MAGRAERGGGSSSWSGQRGMGMPREDGMQRERLGRPCDEQAPETPAAAPAAGARGMCIGAHSHGWRVLGETRVLGEVGEVEAGG